MTSAELHLNSPAPLRLPGHPMILGRPGQHELVKRKMGRSPSPSRREGRDGRDRDRDRERDRDKDRDRDRDRRRSRSPKERDRKRSRSREREDDKKGSSNTTAPSRTSNAGDDMSSSKKREPISIEDRLKELKESKEAVTKPVFLTKEQRQKLALEKLEEKRLEIARERDQLIQNARSDRDRDVRDRDRRERQEREAAAEAAKQASEEVLITDKELQGIKGRYLGEGKKKKKVIKMSDKFRFAFDWELAEDTSKDLNPLYDKKHDAQLLFGRGLRAGIDMREQKKNSTYVEQLEAVRAKIRERMSQAKDDMELDEDDKELRREEQRLMEQEERRQMVRLSRPPLSNI